MVLSLPPLALWVLPVANLAGVARHTLDALTAGVPGWRVAVLCPPGPLVTRLQEAGVPVVAAAFGPDAGLRASIQTLRHTCETLRPAIVHTHLAYADIVAALTPLSGATRVSTEHGIAADDLVYQGTRWRSQLMRRTHQARLHRADRLIAVSRATADAMRLNWRTDAPITIIPNGFDPPSEATERRATDAPRVLSLSRLAPEKRIEALLHAFALLLRDHPGAHLTVAGDGELEGSLRALATRLGIADRVDLPGFVDPAIALAMCDVVAQLSVWENCSYTLLDAVGAGVGVVASPVGGNPEILPAACLADPDAPAQVAAAIARQGAVPAQRPRLPVTWPTRAGMAASIGEVYDSCEHPGSRGPRGAAKP
ncbi:glycosyltransferase [Allobranchiibius sp. CTAmp26]|uniref:glycosyltransferase n=1 Tax=Allobranchiibius sp. CTAmp26 TaxID=2815214 RepID=UPI001AA1ACF2|nr:glycosyltransferase [Allobranchiibius sp. CTAmp26]MBO1755208.1 glycosyltransferase [Allobranchiibius sp. CTAmp26]